MGGQPETRHGTGAGGSPWGQYIALAIAIVLIVSAASVRSVLGAPRRCRPVLLNVTGLPAAVIQDLRGAAASVTAASHVPFVTVEGDVGDREVAVGVAASLPEAPNGRKTVGLTTVFTDHGRIEGGSLSVVLSLTTGYGFNRRGDLGAVFMHELGHVLGIEHSRDERDVMFARATKLPPVWSDRDRGRLEAAGLRNGCSPTTASRRS